jgi:hypothetical protein
VVHELPVVMTRHGTADRDHVAVALNNERANVCPRLFAQAIDEHLRQGVVIGGDGNSRDGPFRSDRSKKQ